MRIGYVKNGDAVEQLEKIVASENVKITSGTEAFIYDLLSSNKDSTFLVLSRGAHNREIQYQHVVAKVFKSVGKGPNTRLLKLFATLRILFELIVFRPQRIVCGCIGEMLWICYCASVILRVPLVHTRHNLMWGSDANLSRRITAAIDNWIIRQLSGVACHGPYLLEQVSNLGVRSGRIFEFDIGFDDLASIQLNGSQSSVAISTGSNRRIDLPVNYILYVGRVEESKGVIDLFEAVVPLLADKQDLHLVVVGDGSAIPELLSQISDKKLGGQILLLGRLPHKKVFSIIRRAIVLVCPTKSSFPEGRCMVAMEGMVIGKPVIAPDLGPFPYLVKHEKNGLLYSPDSVASLRTQIERVLSQDDLKEELEEGAKRTGQELLKPIRTFNEAIKLCFGD